MVTLVNLLVEQPVVKPCTLMKPPEQINPEFLQNKTLTEIYGLSQ